MGFLVDHNTGCGNKALFLILEAIKQGVIRSLPKSVVEIIRQMSLARQPNIRKPARLIMRR